MKLSCIFLCFLISFKSFSQIELQQHILVKYVIIPNITEVDKNLNENKQNENELFKKASEDMRDALVLSEKLMSFELISDNKITIFYRNRLMYPEGIEPMKKILLDNMFNYNYFYSREENKLLKITRLSNRKYLIDFDLNEVKWEILSETKTINNFLCNKAIYIDKRNYKYTAWFAPEINFSIGPEFCFGLPGLVLEYNTETFSIVCKSIDFKPTDDDLKKLTIPEGELITLEDYDEIIKKARESFKN